jgi:hypothetical protein
MRVREHCIGVLLASGFSPAVAARSYATLGHYVVGFAIQMNGHGNADRLDDPQVSALFHDLDAAQFPATVAVADSLPVSVQDEFAFGLDLILSGLSQLRRSERRPSRTRRQVED